MPIYSNKMDLIPYLNSTGFKHIMKRVGSLVNILKGHSKFNMKFKAMLPKSVKREKGNAMWVIFFLGKLK
jgi:hypothetical protein